MKQELMEKAVLEVLSDLVKGTEKDICTDEQLKEFARYWAEEYKLDILNDFLDYVCGMDIECDVCRVCGKLFLLKDAPNKHFCSKECIDKLLSK